ncbi:hypothetical protein VOLCADRAFT_91721 [Volvox carteri f. nagariensis]|uniref:WSC domain-containing protein n=1 Tax=Volvox carteri f. nagariensis TaxID=3068 RepID=D8TXT8_VOLCA|nr:uncharacterized protein VOLCADRAFT_91721 [Volvox carteri f. nagariensis]EFJ47699.1 hypothetical protein VOLCADRAFT_91721 [Volvox carteri f. nagariensis]|eukprot:XP_002951170.1 hypothetical protein VOLCADRAFT_91721 [Volvox carteri f. nagariensis]
MAYHGNYSYSCVVGWVDRRSELCQQEKQKEYLAVYDFRMSVSHCRGLAKAAGLPYFGVEYGQQCYGGSDMARAVSLGPSNGCTLSCLGDPSEICGGGWAIDIYETSPSGMASKYSSGYIGCFADDADRVLPERLADNDPNMSVSYCRNLAKAAGLPYFGVEYGQECYGGSDMEIATRLGRSSNCTHSCSGDTSKICGGDWAVNIYETSPIGMYGEHRWTSKGYIGCFNDDWDRALPQYLVYYDPGMSVSYCRGLAKAAGLPYFGVEFGQECYGGSDMARAISHGRNNTCTHRCSGDPSEICGGGWAIDIYETSPSGFDCLRSRRIVRLLVIVTFRQSPSEMEDFVFTQLVDLSPTRASTLGGYIGCFADDADRVLPERLADNDPNMSVSYCRNLAKAAGLPYFGVEYGQECYGGSDMEIATRLGRSSNCTHSCSGDTSQICGGDWAVNIYETSPIATSEGYIGCFVDNADRVLPQYLAVYDYRMSLSYCRGLAKAAGLPYFGVEYGQECYGGSDMARAVSLGPSNGCTHSCLGDPSEICGGDWAIDIYETSPSGQSPPAFFHTILKMMGLGVAEWRVFSEVEVARSRMVLQWSNAILTLTQKRSCWLDLLKVVSFRAKVNETCQAGAGHATALKATTIKFKQHRRAQFKQTTLTQQHAKALLQ